MTDLIDYTFTRKQQRSSRCSSSLNSYSSKQQTKKCIINEVVQKFMRKINKNYIKTNQSFIFEIGHLKNLALDSFYDNRVKIMGMISFKSSLFSLRMEFVNLNGLKINARSSYHRALISNFAMEINSQLKNFKFQYNPVSGEICFVFNVKSQKHELGLVQEIFQFGLNSYFSQCSAHFYVLNIIEFSNQSQNQYLKNIEEDLFFIKKWLIGRQEQNKCFFQRFNFYKNFLKIQSYNQEKQNKMDSTISSKYQIKSIQKYLFSQTKIVFNENKISSNRIRQVYKRFKKYIKQEDIFSVNLLNKINHPNYISINAKQTRKLQQFLSGNCIFNDKQLEELLAQKYVNFLKQNKFNQKLYEQVNADNQYVKSQKSQKNEQKVNVCDKNTGKNYLVKCIYLNKQNSIKEHNICQKLCKTQSFRFFNQYIHLTNYNLSKQGYIVVNAYPKRRSLSQFLQRHDRILSFNSKIKICINLVQIVLTLHLKSKINGYFPVISPRNLQISRSLCLNFKTLSYFTNNPLFQLTNTLSVIFFEKPINMSQKAKSIFFQNVEGDESQNKNWGPSICVSFLKFYLLQLYKDAQRMIAIKQFRVSHKISHSHNQQMEMWIKRRLSSACQQLLIILSHYQSIFSRGYQQQQYDFEIQSEDEI